MSSFAGDKSSRLMQGRPCLAIGEQLSLIEKVIGAVSGDLLGPGQRRAR